MRAAPGKRRMTARASTLRSKSMKRRAVSRGGRGTGFNNVDRPKSRAKRY